MKIQKTWPHGALIPTWQHWLPPLDGHLIFRLPQPHHSPLIPNTEVGASCRCFPHLLYCFLNPDSFLSFAPYRHLACVLRVNKGREYCWILSRSEHSPFKIQQNKTPPLYYGKFQTYPKVEKIVYLTPCIHPSWHPSRLLRIVNVSSTSFPTPALSLDYCKRNPKYGLI